MSKNHIRDFLAINGHEYTAGQVSTTAMCGETDPDMNKLAFGDPAAILKKEIPFCEKCRNKWVEEAESLGGQKQMMNKFRRIIQKSANFTRFGRR